MTSIEEHTFVEPTRRVKTLADLARWNNSEAYRDLLGFIVTVNNSVKSKTLQTECHVSVAVEKIMDLLNKLDIWITEIPPIEQPQRFGNKAFRDWFKRLEDNLEELILPILPDNGKGAVVELQTYLRDSFGNSTRIDYGTGHEVCFIFFLCCLYKLRILEKDDDVAIVNVIFDKYLELVRKLQLTYRMEPAGSHGVWGLDDHQFVPFIWGSSQLINHNTILPKEIASIDAGIKYYKDYMFFGCIKYINEVKNGPFAEHSNTLWGMSGVPHWTKINEGLIKMYKAEVLGKFPIVQHFCFGSLISFAKAVK